jgi:hypothetical protein
MKDFEPYRTDHLFLIVGANPLPNFVAALLLSKKGGTIHLLHSKGTVSQLNFNVSPEIIFAPLPATL